MNFRRFLRSEKDAHQATRLSALYHVRRLGHRSVVRIIRCLGRLHHYVNPRARVIFLPITKRSQITTNNVAMRLILTCRTNYHVLQSRGTKVRSKINGRGFERTPGSRSRLHSATFKGVSRLDRHGHGRVMKSHRQLTIRVASKSSLILIKGSHQIIHRKVSLNGRCTKSVPSHVFHHPICLQSTTRQVQILRVLLLPTSRFTTLRGTTRDVTHLSLSKVQARLLSTVRGEVSPPIRNFRQRNHGRVHPLQRNGDARRNGRTINARGLHAIRRHRSLFARRTRQLPNGLIRSASDLPLLPFVVRVSRSSGQGRGVHRQDRITQHPGQAPIVSSQRRIVVGRVGSALRHCRLRTTVPRQRDVHLRRRRRTSGRQTRLVPRTANVTFRRVLLRNTRFVQQSVLVARKAGTYHSTMGQLTLYLSLPIRVVTTALSAFLRFQNRFRLRVSNRCLFSAFRHRQFHPRVVCVSRGFRFSAFGYSYIRSDGFFSVQVTSSSEGSTFSSVHLAGTSSLVSMELVQAFDGTPGARMQTIVVTARTSIATFQFPLYTACVVISVARTVSSTASVKAVTTYFITS